MIISFTSTNLICFVIKNDDDEEIDSDEADGVDGHDVGYESEEDKETAEEKKLRLAKLYLQEYWRSSC